jgi:4-amino-4-deoxychorismate lyase
MTLLALAVSGRGVVSPDEPVLHADDEALGRGRAVFETLRVYGGRPFRIDEHLARLGASAAKIGLPPVDAELLRGLAHEALAAAGAGEATLRFYWTPGRDGTGAPVGLALVSTLPDGHDAERERGLRLVTTTALVSPLMAGVKSTSYAFNIAARDDALRRDADDTLFVAPDGTVLEGTTANVVWREGTTLVTPSLELPILDGVTRRVVLELAPELGYGLEEGTFPLERLLAADEALLCSTVREVAPVVAIDGRPIGAGTPGDAAAALQRGLRQRAAE